MESAEHSFPDSNYVFYFPPSPPPTYIVVTVAPTPPPAARVCLARLPLHDRYHALNGTNWTSLGCNCMCPDTGHWPRSGQAGESRHGAMTEEFFLIFFIEIILVELRLYNVALVSRPPATIIVLRNTIIFQH